MKAIKFANENVERRHWITQSINGSSTFVMGKRVEIKDTVG